MIQKISGIGNIVFKGNENTGKNNKQTIKPKQNSYIDSFVKNSVKSAPMLLALTGVWSIFDNKVSKIPFQKAFVNNIVSFCAPVLVLSSAGLALLENKNYKDKAK